VELAKPGSPGIWKKAVKAGFVV